MVSLTMSTRGIPDVTRATSAWGLALVGRTARGRPPSPLIGAWYVWAVQWIALVSGLLQQWACG